MRKQLAFLIAIILLSVTFAPSGTAFACSGSGAYNLEYLLEKPDTIAIGKFVDLDDLKLNGTLQVDYYLKGVTHPQYMALSVNSMIDVERYLAERFSPGECPYIKSGFEIGQLFIVFANHETDGTFKVDALFTNLAEGKNLFADSKGTEYYFSGNELQDFVASKLSVSPILPDTTTPYPLRAPLLITTASKTAYLLPVDGSQDIKLSAEEAANYNVSDFCNTPQCTVRSPNHLEHASLLADNETELDTAHTLDNRFKAKALLFSQTNDALAVWRDTSIEIYPFVYPKLGSGRTGVINSIAFESNSNKSLVYGAAAWSPDGRLLAYSDAKGLWLWDVFTVGSRPRWLIPTQNNEIPYARYFSARGRYIAVTQGGQNYNFDTISGANIVDGLISPNERSILAFDTTAKSEFEVKFQWLAPNNRPADNTYEKVYQVQWINEGQYLLATREHGYGLEDGTYVDEDYRAIKGISVSIDMSYQTYLGTAFAYNMKTKQLARITADKEIMIGEATYDLSNQIDDVITALHWLPFIYYYDTSTDYRTNPIPAIHH